MKDKILRWLGNGATGVSSRTMALAAVGMPNDGSHPCDPDDLNRCLKLLRAVPEIRQHMDRVAEINDIWGRLISRWDEVEQCFLNEVGFDWSRGKSAPLTYSLMKDVGC